MDETITKRDLENILHEILAHGSVNKKELVSSRNIFLLRDWAIKNGMPEDEFYLGVNEGYDDKIKKGKKAYIPNEISLQFFNNAEGYFGKGPEIFLKAGYESIKDDYLFTNVMPHFMGKSLNDLVNNVVALNSKFNKTKLFDISHEFDERTGEGTYVLSVTPIAGLSSPKSVIFWNIGIYNHLISQSSDEILSNLPEIDENTGSFKITVKYSKGKKGFVEKTLPGITGMIKGRLKETLDEASRHALLEQSQVMHMTASEAKAINSVLGSLETKHPKTANHSRKVFYWAVLKGKQMGMNYEDLNILAQGASLHDYGKNAIPETILHKAGKFERDESLIMKSHTLLGEFSLLELHYCPQIARIASEHHELPNGMGQPYGFSIKGISIPGIILQVLDKFDALTENRVYRTPNAYTYDEASRILRKELNRENSNPVYEFILENMNRDVSELFDFSHSRINEPPMSKSSIELLGYIKGHNKKFDVNIPKEVKDMLRLHKVSVEPISERYHRIGTSLAQIYREIKDDEYKVMFKRIIPQYFMNSGYFPKDGIKAI